jgi:hypothetical protein
MTVLARVRAVANGVRMAAAEVVDLLRDILEVSRIAA